MLMFIIIIINPYIKYIIHVQKLILKHAFQLIGHHLHINSNYI